MLGKGICVEARRKARAVFIPKPGKKAYNVPKAFRPLCLTSVFLKTMERLVDFHMKEDVLPICPPEHQQYAYQANVSTDAAIHQIVSRAEEAIDKGRLALAVFLDIEGPSMRSRWKR